MEIKNSGQVKFLIIVWSVTEILNGWQPNDGVPVTSIVKSDMCAVSLISVDMVDGLVSAPKTPGHNYVSQRNR